MQGKVKKYDKERAFGWIDNGQLRLLFFHISQWSGKDFPVVGQLANFTEGIDKKGRLEAQAVTPEIEVAVAAETSTTEVK